MSDDRKRKEAPGGTDDDQERQANFERAGTIVRTVKHYVAYRRDVPFVMPMLGEEDYEQFSLRGVLPYVIQDTKEFESMYMGTWAEIDARLDSLPSHPRKDTSEAALRFIMKEAAEVKEAARAVFEKQTLHAAMQSLPPDAVRAFRKRRDNPYYCKGALQEWSRTLTKVEELCSEGVLRSAIVCSGNELDALWRAYTEAADSLKACVGYEAGPPVHGQAYRPSILLPDPTKPTLQQDLSGF